ncbi:polysaccharide deacetylase family protein [Micromonospora phytophila]|uniref:polysaccharide deacetylase family protein n=1 Tax=Micromonospora phytophila TaxID=709888 RepID=UPI00202DE260|nr:polysaccharide deacetylase family protein [Micromonospora phytophila]MCM0675685.1 polysaccharide deacetylase family protein [Micromonospora phytophila]
MRAAPAARAVGMITLVVTALLGSAYALGRTLVPDPPRSDSRVTTSADGPHYADQPPADNPPEPTPQNPGGDRGAGPTETGQDGYPAPSGRTTTDPPFHTQDTTGTQQVALTFDDGPDPQYTPQVLAVLRQHQVKATFCVVGENARNHPDLIREIVADGHTLCNHSWNHDVALGKRSPDAIRADLLRTSEAIRAAVPAAPIAWYRQPGGAWTSRVVTVAEELGMTSLHWTVDPSDWRAPGAGRIAATVVTGVEPGSVVLLHDAGGDRQGTVDALHRILPDLTSRFQVEALPNGAT